MVVILTTARLELRRFEPGDLDRLAEWYADGAVRAGFPDGVLTRSGTAAEMEFFRAGGHPGHPDLCLWAAVERASGEMVGRGGLLPLDLDGQAEVEVAWLVGPRYWRRGYGGEMARGLVAHGMDVLRLARLVAMVEPANVASAATASAAGMRFERMIDHNGPAQLWAIGQPSPSAAAKAPS